jgi:hypothetical protein
VGVRVLLGGGEGGGIMRGYVFWATWTTLVALTASKGQFKMSKTKDKDKGQGMYLSQMNSRFTSKRKIY